MSHFVVIVIGDDYELQLAPFDEEIRVDPYKDYVGVDTSFTPGERLPWELSWASKREHLRKFCEAKGITEKAFYVDTIEGDERSLFSQSQPGPIQQEFEALHEDYTPSWDVNNLTLNDLLVIAELISADDDDTYGADDNGLFRWSNYNPESKWDWYQVGGRWAGYFPVKPNATSAKRGQKSWGWGDEEPPEGTADRIQKKDIDFSRARNEAREQAEEEFDAYWEVIQHHPGTNGWSHYAERVRAKTLEIEDARRLYHDQPGYVALKNASKDGYLWDCPVDTFGSDRAAYITRCVNRALVPLALLVNGAWQERTSMGWFGMTFDEQMSQDEWDQRVSELFDSLDDDTWLTAIDCHI